ncbi:hypothetical protein [Lacibacter sediminis]|uniref:Uncharacterized protein n=1 Tax=Lacibacter sediminis TaxID=2760713 RepID=A0A7G5XK46_9BACT|nr:hypothetical protein [Lacibacter sediminis]QNA45849.1 hypothetical protein H4075_06555 [Lacibacter sediminis]
MTKHNKVCRLCGEELDITHGNRRYHEDCAYEAKKQRSIDQYAGRSLQLDPYWRNEKILKDLYCSYGEQHEIDPTVLKEMGFDFNICKTKRQVNGLNQVFMHQYGFSILQNKKIILWKL